MSNIEIVIAGYGTSGSGPEEGDVLTKQAAEDLAVQTKGKVFAVDSDTGHFGIPAGGKFRVVSTRLEGDEKQGRVLAECESVIEEELKRGEWICPTCGQKQPMYAPLPHQLWLKDNPEQVVTACAECHHRLTREKKIWKEGKTGELPRQAKQDA